MDLRKLLYLQPRGPSQIQQDAFKAAGWEIHVATEIAHAQQLCEKHGFRVGLMGLAPGVENNLPQNIDKLISSALHTEWVALLSTQQIRNETIRHLITSYCYDYHTLPIDYPRLLTTMGHAYGMVSMACQQISQSIEELGPNQMVGVSPAMQQVYRSIRKIASVDMPILITGESGTGKELAALAIHERSMRVNGPFMAVNCGALPPELIQSELFGHEKGAFTGAIKQKFGQIELAAGGTVFLDEIGDLPLNLQVNLLRFLQEGTFKRVGGTQEMTIDARVMAATHVDLEKAVSEGHFREDLYYRLNVLNLRMPSLAERENDIEILAKYFFEKFSDQTTMRIKGFSQEALRRLHRHAWPGNVRELINRIRRAMVMCEGRLITPIDLGLERRLSNRRIMTLAEARARAEKETILRTLRQAKGNVSQTAIQLGISRPTLYRLMEKYKISI
ncbi:sigma-54 dependent transcriptional regulator [Nitrosococcus wardiae]|uniref:Sigma-54-dependent Fis family transcriptional regulator n=1 Tax=Nitrosococcus wardiae TaxID=1814290 RepID=A0A4P7BZW1_9GAMM|nr:sigma-54 dependent transcriptional regulator [Nitrosococcus wardiae]QBQ55671.1 sigma-54-dependent Fis family transcriptional regulator [Nitrosococcus wardiae]